MRPLMISQKRMTEVALNHRMKIALGAVVTVILLLLAIGLPILLHKRNQPKQPVFEVVAFSATPLNSSSTTWNITLSISNPNPNRPKLTLYIETLSVIVLDYTSFNDTEPVGEAIHLGPLVVQGKSNILQSFSVVVVVVGGRVDAGLSGSVNFRLGSKDSKTRYLLCRKRLAIRLGVVSGLPRTLDLGDVGV